MTNTHLHHNVAEGRRDLRSFIIRKQERITRERRRGRTKKREIGEEEEAGP